MATQATYPFDLPLADLQRLYPSLQQGPTTRGGMPWRREERRKDAGGMVEGGAVVVWEEDKLVACVGDSVIAAVEGELKLGKDHIVSPVYEVVGSKSTMFGLGVQVATLDPLSTNWITYIPRDAEGKLLVTKVNPEDFWAFGCQSEGEICFLVRGKSNRDGTVKFEYNIECQLKEGAKFGVKVLFRGSDVTPTVPQGFYVDCVAKVGFPPPKLIISDRDATHIAAANIQLVRNTFSFIIMHANFVADKDENGKEIIFTSPEGFLRCEGHIRFVAYALTILNAHQIEAFYGETVSGIPLDIKVERPPVLVELAGKTMHKYDNSSCLIA